MSKLNAQYERRCELGKCKNIANASEIEIEMGLGMKMEMEVGMKPWVIWHTCPSSATTNICCPLALQLHKSYPLALIFCFPFLFLCSCCNRRNMKAKFLAHISQTSTADNASQVAMNHLPSIYWCTANSPPSHSCTFAKALSFAHCSIPRRFTRIHTHKQNESL